MNVTKNRVFDDVIILGSSKSILDLTENEIAYINKCKIVIALNKYMAFYKKSKIVPTHVFFLDNHDNSTLFLEYIIKVCRKDNLKNLSFILHESLKTYTYTNRNQINKIYLNFIYNYIIKLIRRKQRNSIFKIENYPKVNLLPMKSKVVFTTPNNWLEGGEWAVNLKQPLYHYRGSLTSVLNYVSIIAPKKSIYLVGSDFNSSIYFFEKELNNLNFITNDWTTPIIKKENKHFSAIDYNGTTIFDKLPYVIEKLYENENRVYCNNKESLLVKNGGIQFKNLPYKK